MEFPKIWPLTCHTWVKYWSRIKNNTTNREYSARAICWSFLRSSTTLSLGTPRGGVTPNFNFCIRRRQIDGRETLFFFLETLSTFASMAPAIQKLFQKERGVSVPQVVAGRECLALVSPYPCPVPLRTNTYTAYCEWVLPNNDGICCKMLTHLHTKHHLHRNRTSHRFLQTVTFSISWWLRSHSVTPSSS